MPLAMDVAKEIAKNIAMSSPRVRKWRLKKPRAGMLYTGDEAQLRRYVFGALDMLEDAVGSLKGATIAEVGPGDFLSAALAFLAAGARSYTSLDRFMGDYGRPDGKAWYRGVHDSWPLFRNAPWPSDLDPDMFPEAYTDRVRTFNQPVESASQLGQFDIVCSFSVAEHVSDIHSFARANADLLAPGGVALHRVDFGPHDVWRSYPDTLMFLRFPEPIWAAMGSARGYPNRHRVHELVAAFERAGLQVDLKDTELLPLSAANLLPRRMRQMPVDSVRTNLATLVARKRG